MSTEQRTPTGGVQKPRTTKESSALHDTIEESRFLATAQDRWWFQALTVSVPALVAALVLSPSLTGKRYPTDEALVGSPARENIKSPIELIVEDTDATVALTEAARSSVARVYDFDTKLGSQIAEQVRETLAPKGADGERPLTLAARVAMVKKELKVPASEALLRMLNASKLDVGGWVTTLLASPVVATAETLAPDALRGITLQHVPEDGSDPTVVKNVESILTVAQLHARVVREAAVRAPSASPKVRAELVAFVKALLAHNLTLNRAATEVARSDAALAVKPANIQIKKGEMIIRDGERFNARHLLIFRSLNSRSQKKTNWLIGFGAFMVSALMAVLLLITLGRSHLAIRMNGRDLLFLSLLSGLILLLARGWLTLASVFADAFPNLPMSAFLVAFPVAAGAMVVRFVLRIEPALVFGIYMGLLLGAVFDVTRFYTLYAIVGSVAGTISIRKLSARLDVFRSGLWVGGAQVIAAIAIQFLTFSFTGVELLLVAVTALASGMVAAFIALAMTSVIEWLFNYTTDLKLLELANLNHPALRELLVQAPGSYHHSILVGSLAEAAAEAVHANPLLARVMAYYHDLGKGCNPVYFVENQKGSKNPHDKLKPSMSAMIIRRHVTDGLEIAARHNLPAPVRAAIAEHHGTTLIHYFFEKARKDAELNDAIGLTETEFRYPGRKPQSREAAVLMLADSIEAASRSLADPTPARLKGLVHRIINHKFTDGQLEECDLTLRDLHTIAKAFSMVLTSLYHERPEYPGLLNDISSKKNGDSSQKSTKPAADSEQGDQTDRPDDLKRLGLSESGDLGNHVR